MITKRSIRSWFVAQFVLVIGLPTIVLGQGAEVNPTGPTGVYNGNITTAGSYDPLTGNQMRIVDDLVVPGSVGAYPLKWTRYFNTNIVPGDYTQWTFSYKDYRAPDKDGFGGYKVPDGRQLPNSPSTGNGISDYGNSVINGAFTQHTIHLSDGGKVNFQPVWQYSSGLTCPIELIDPYGQVTTMTYVTRGPYPPNSAPINVLDRVTEPGGRYLQITWQDSPTNSMPVCVISRVEAFDGRGNSLGFVNYSYTQWRPPNTGSTAQATMILNRADYADNTFANYNYAALEKPLGNGTHFTWANLFTADDVRHDGPMRQIAYGGKNSTGNLVFGFAIESNLSTKDTLTSVAADGNDKHQLPDGSWSESWIRLKETRADNATRTFTYDYSCTWSHPQINPDATQCGDNVGKIIAYTDFLGNTTKVAYDASNGPSLGYIASVTDANNQQTTYTRSSQSWGILKITHPDGTHIDQTYTDEAHPYYLASRTDENGHTTVYKRTDSKNPNAITEKDYADGTIETFAYNPLGQVTTHGMRNGAYQHFSYDGRGLLLAKTNPTLTSDPSTSLGQDPQTKYTYYTSGPWTDRIQTEIDPRGLVTQYDYDRAYDSNHENSGFSTGQAQVAGRGLVTRITHLSDNTYQSFGYDFYGRKLWQEDELRHRTTYGRDDYGRVVSVTNPLQQTAKADYTPPGFSNPYVHTTNSVYTATTPTGIVTTNAYDANFHLRSTTAGVQSSQPATTWFGYDAVGNPTKVTDPRGDSNQTTYTTITDYDNRNRKWHVIDPLGNMTTFGYDGASNVTSITRPDQSVENKTYNEVNKLLTDTVPKAGPAPSPTEKVTTTFDYYPGGAQMGGELMDVIQQQQSDTSILMTRFEYDPSGVKTRMYYPKDTIGHFDPQQYQQWTYDFDHNLVARQTVNGVSQLFSYDNRNRQIWMTWSNGLDWASFGYDDASRMTSAQNPTSTITRAYDNANRLTDDQQQLQIMPIRAVSHKSHGSAYFDVDLPLVGAPGVECRAGQGPSSDMHQIIVTFPQAITFNGWSVSKGTATIASPPSTSPDGTQVTINLSGVANAQTIIVKLSGVSDGSLTNDVNIGMGVLLGDVNGNGIVDGNDISTVQAESRQTLSTSNFRSDVNLNGLIDGNDVSMVQGQSRTSCDMTRLSQPVPPSPIIDVQYGYDADGKEASLSVTGAGAAYNVVYGYDGLGRLNAISKANGPQFTYTYDLASNETHRAHTNGLDEVFTRDPLNRITERDVTNSGSAISVEIYGYDPSRPGLLTSVTRREGGQAPTHDAFGYDLLPELTSAQYNLSGSASSAATTALNLIPLSLSTSASTPPNPSQRTVSYIWDRAGNRSSMSDSGGPSYAYSVNNLNQYTSDGSSFMTNGTEHELASYQGVTYNYINDTHLSSVSGTDVFGKQSSYQLYYDALGRCVVRILNGSTTFYIYDGEKSILEYQGWSAPSAVDMYGRGIDEILMRTDYTGSSPQTVYYQDDHEGNITHLTDSTGAVQEYYRYDAFGKPTIYSASGTQINTSKFNNRIMFTGREYVATFGIYEYRNRAYHPGLGRFMSEDPKGFDAGDNNFFRYVGNDPLDKTDPMGTCIEDACVGEAILVSIIAAEAAAVLQHPSVQKAFSDFGKGVNSVIHQAKEALTVHSTHDEGVRDIGGKPPFPGKPGETVRGPTQTRRYGPDGWPETDHDRGGHVHDWGRPKDGGPPKVPGQKKNPYRSHPGRDPKPGDPPKPRGSDSKTAQASQTSSTSVVVTAPSSQQSSNTGASSVEPSQPNNNINLTNDSSPAFPWLVAPQK